MKMNYKIENVKFGEGTIQFSIDNIDINIEVAVEELKASYDFFHGIMDRVTTGIKELAPIIASAKKEVAEIDHKNRMVEEEQRKNDNIEINAKMHQDKMQEISAETEMYKLKFNKA